MDLESNQGWMSDFLEEMGLPTSAVFQGYVLYCADEDGFVSDKDQRQLHYVKPCAWAHRFPYIMLASDAAHQLGGHMEIRGLFRLGGKYLSYPI